MEEFKKNWMSQLIKGLESEKNFTILHDCGGNCAEQSGMLDEIKTFKSSQEISDNQSLVELLKESPFKDHKIEENKDAVQLTYNFTSCVCPIMSQMVNPHACQCTVGFLNKSLEALTGKSFTIEIVDSYIKNNLPCSFQIYMD